MSIYEHNSVEKNFDSVLEDMSKAKALTLAKIKELENANDIKKIERLQTLLLESIKISTWTDSGIYADRNLKIRIDGSKELFELLKVRPDIKCGIQNYRSYGDTLNFLIVSMTEEAEAENKEAFRGFINALAAVDEATHKENLRRVENNQQTERSIFNLLERIGINQKYYGYSSKRSSKQTHQYYEFPSEIRRQIPTLYSENNMEELAAAKIKAFAEIYDRELKKIREARIQKEKEEAERLSNKKLALLLAKYDLSLECEWSDVLEAIINKDKYLRLGHYLESNRNDWNEGCDSAETGLGGFHVETTEDQDIYDDISSYLGENWDCDGRVFRDCRYNYSVLYGMVQDNGLYDDYCEVKENIKD